MKRKIYSQLLKWKTDNNGQNALLIDGARRVGKSYIVAQMLRAKGHKLFFYSNYSREAEDRMEIDFLIAKPTITSKHNISPIEVKSTSRYTISSLEKCIKKYGSYLATPYVLHTSDLEQKNGIVYLPLYMTPML